jgi:hypothetical protein
VCAVEVHDRQGKGVGGEKPGSSCWGSHGCHFWTGDLVVVTALVADQPYGCFTDFTDRE